MIKLRNKKTGEIVKLKSFQMEYTRHYDYGEGRSGEQPCSTYNQTLSELNAEWEDVPEEPKGGYIIDPMEEDCLSVDDSGYEESDVERAKELGIWFETEEEAKRAAKQLKAFKKLKDFGFRFIDWELDMKTVADGKIWFDLGTNTEWDAERLLELKPEIKKSLDIFFGGEE